MVSENPLGKTIDYPQKYAPDVLVGIPRALNRSILNLAKALPFTGADVWNAYECSWLNPKGKPVSVILRLVIPCTTPNLVESKSLKLYFNSLNQMCYSDTSTVLETIQRDLEQLLEGKIYIAVCSLDSFEGHTQTLEGTCIDDLDLAITAQQPDAALLNTDSDALPVSEVVYSNLFRSLCPITGQPDWATVTVCYQGAPISHMGLLHYLVSYRQHNDYHEHCVERIFCDIQRQCKPESLTVEANFLRRGGVDINPVRSTERGGNYLDYPRYLRQ